MTFAAMMAQSFATARGLIFSERLRMRAYKNCGLGPGAPEGPRLCNCRTHLPGRGIEVPRLGLAQPIYG